MARLLASALLAAQLASVGAAPFPEVLQLRSDGSTDVSNPYGIKTPVCGSLASNGKGGVCVDTESIMSTPYAQYQSDNKYYLFGQCRAACDETSECQTVLYYNIGGTFDNAGQWACVLLSQPVAPHTIPCGDGRYDSPDDTPFARNTSYIGGVFNPASQNSSALYNYFEKACPPDTLQRRYDGEVPPAQGGVLNCGSTSTTHQSYADLMFTAPGNNQTQCRDLCKKTANCKSYWWQPFESASEKPFNTSTTTYLPSVMDCALFSQPIAEHGVPTEFPLPMFDINCNPGNGTI